MSAIFYQELDDVRYGTPKNGSAFDPSKCNAVKCYLKHYEASLVLSWWFKNGNLSEKKQAGIELTKSQNGMKFWEKQPNFNLSEAIPQIQELKRKYNY